MARFINLIYVLSVNINNEYIHLDRSPRSSTRAEPRSKGPWKRFQNLLWTQPLVTRGPLGVATGFDILSITVVLAAVAWIFLKTLIPEMRLSNAAPLGEIQKWVGCTFVSLILFSTILLYVTKSYNLLFSLRVSERVWPELPAGIRSAWDDLQELLHEQHCCHWRSCACQCREAHLCLGWLIYPSSMLSSTTDGSATWPWLSSACILFFTFASSSLSTLLSRFAESNPICFTLFLIF